MPVTPSTTESICPPTADATTGTPQAIASSGTMPNGPYQGGHTTAAAERRSAGNPGRSNRPREATELGVVGQPLSLGPARDDKVTLGQRGKRRDDVSDAFALHQPRHDDE